MKLREEQAKAMGGCAPCQFEPVAPPGPGAPPAGGGTPPRSVVVVDPDRPDTFVTIELVDTKGAPVPYARYLVTMPGGRSIEGTLDLNGRVRLEGVEPGTCTVTFPAIDRREFA